MLLAEPILQTKLPYLLHLGFVEIRYLAHEEGTSQQIAKLADVMEYLPRALEPGCRAIEDSAVREQFEQYLGEFPESIYAARYLAILDGVHTPINY